MKRILIPLLLAPGVAIAGLVIVDQVPAAEKTKQTVVLLALQEVAKGTPKTIQSAPVGLIVPADIVPLSPTLTIKKGRPVRTVDVPENKTNLVGLAASLLGKSVIGKTNTSIVDATSQYKEAPPVQSLQAWQITLADSSVRGLLERWCKESGYQLLWEVSVDLQIGASATVTGTFEEALNSLLASLTNSEYPVEAMVYDNRVVRIVKHIPKNI